MTGKFQRVAHRGGSQLAPQNTLAAFRNALALPIDAIELDVHLSRDGQLVVIHDNTVEKLTDGEGNILDLDFAYLRSLNAAAHFPGGWPQAQQIRRCARCSIWRRDAFRCALRSSRANAMDNMGAIPAS